MDNKDSKKIRIVVADGHSLTREAICNLLSSDDDIEIVAVADSAEDIVRYCNGHRPDVVVIDPDSSNCSNLVFGAIREASPNSAILVLSSNESPLVTRETFRCGVDGYVMKGEPLETFFKALRTVADGHSYVNPRTAIEIAQIDSQEDESGLTDREKEILQGIAYGFTNSEIGDNLYLSIRTVESHRAHICQKLDASNRHDLVMAAIEFGLMELTGSAPDQTSTMM